MRRADQVAGVLLLVLGIAYVAVGREYPYWAPTGPGSGFLPVWLGVAMAVLALFLLVGATRSRDPGPPWWPDGRGLRRLLVVIGLTALFIVVMKPVGMILGTALFLVVILRWVEGHRWRTALGVAAATAAANYAIFTYWLRVPFPVGLLGF